MRGLFACGLAALAAACLGVDVGTFDNSRLFSTSCNFVTGTYYTLLKADWDQQGAVWHETGTLTPEFLSNVQVFITGMVNTVNMTPDEQTALEAWVQSGGTLIATGDCSCEYDEQLTFNTIINPFGISIAGGTAYGWGTVLAQHPITNNLTRVYLANNGWIGAGTDAVELFSGPYDSDAGVALERTGLAGLGRIVVIGDKDMVADPYVETYPENRTLSRNLAAWVMSTPACLLKGNCALADFVGNPAGVPLALNLYQGGTLVQTVQCNLDSAGNYAVLVASPGQYDIVAKPSHWLSVRQSGVSVTSAAAIDWRFPHNGDVDGNNFVGLGDLGSVLRLIAETGAVGSDLDGDGVVGVADLSIVLANFSLAGEQ